VVLSGDQTGAEAIHGVGPAYKGNVATIGGELKLGESGITGTAELVAQAEGWARRFAKVGPGKQRGPEGCHAGYEGPQPRRALPLPFEQQKVAVVDGLQAACGILLQAGFEQAANSPWDGVEVGLFLHDAGEGFGEIFAFE
jgi:hypothetical protein